MYRSMYSVSTCRIIVRTGRDGQRLADGRSSVAPARRLSSRVSLPSAPSPYVISKTLDLHALDIISLFFFLSSCLSLSCLASLFVYVFCKTPCPPGACRILPVFTHSSRSAWTPDSLIAPLPSQSGPARSRPSHRVPHCTPAVEQQTCLSFTSLTCPGSARRDSRSPFLCSYSHTLSIFPKINKK